MNTGSPIVDKVSKMGFTGNVIPETWYKAITRKTGKPYLNAIVILADIVYWYRPKEVRDEATGEVIRREKRFKADFLQRNYQQIADKFGISKRDALNATDHLKDLGIIKKHLRTIVTNEGAKISNVLFIELCVDALEKITFGNPDEGQEEEEQSDLSPKKVIPPSVLGDTSSQKKVRAVQKNSDTNTEITTEITTEISSSSFNSIKMRKEYMTKISKLINQIKNDEDIPEDRHKKFIIEQFERAVINKNNALIDLKMFSERSLENIHQVYSYLQSQDSYTNRIFKTAILNSISVIQDKNIKKANLKKDNSFNNFPQRTYDYAELEKSLQAKT